MVTEHSIKTESAVISVLVVSRMAQDHEAVRETLSGSKWKFYSASDIASAIEQLRRNRGISLVLSDCEFWRQMLIAATELKEPPLVIVAAAHADERLWAEALNIGAFDVLAKPFDTAELVRSLSMGWRYWRRSVAG